MPEKKQGPNVGARIKEARLQSGLSQVEFARELNRAGRTVQTWESNSRTPRPAAMRQIAELTERPVSWFWTSAEPEDIAA